MADPLFVQLNPGSGALMFSLSEDGNLNIFVYTNVDKTDTENYIPGLLGALAHITLHEQDFVLQAFEALDEAGRPEGAVDGATYDPDGLAEIDLANAAPKGSA